MIISRSITFEAAHWLPNYKGKCNNVHGHRWKVEIGVEGPLEIQTGMVLDFGYLKQFLEEFVKEPLDHTMVNDTLPNPTAENIAEDIAMQWKNSGINQVYPKVSLSFVKVWETENSCAEWRS